MKTKPCGRILVIVILAAATVLWAGEPWKDKPFTEWGEKDVWKLLEKSPWAKRIHQAGMRRRSTGSSRMEGGGVVGIPINIDEIKHALTVVWSSALTVREALVRQRQLQGTPNKEDSSQLLSQQPENYEIRVHGPAVSTCCPEPYSCYLQPRRSKQAISPFKVQFVRQDDESWTEFRFYFVRNLAGKPAIGPDEKKVEFYCQSDSGPFKAVFDLRKMTRNSKPDL
ncbi:MAG: hypothetical protein IH846_05895 [Acidobacteria bacterium]|nr:hypothetical protein [Acidobacteriota bacterium]